MQIEQAPTERNEPKPDGERRGLILVNTGDGKGKSTAAFGLALRAFGRTHVHGKQVRIFQFMKVPTARFGEHRVFEQLAEMGPPLGRSQGGAAAAEGSDPQSSRAWGPLIEGLGDGFSWKSKDLDHSAQLARDGWQRAKAAILGGEHFLVVLDEITYPLIYGWLPLNDVLETLKARPRDVNVCLTGRRCPQEIIDIADTVTEMQLVKHAYKAGIPAQRGIED